MAPLRLDEDTLWARRVRKLVKENIALKEALGRQMRNAKRAETALRAIIARADNGALGTSKVQDMRRLAVEALEG